MPKSISKNYSTPKVKASGDEWYVWFRFLDERTGKMKLIIRKGGANYSGLPDKERLAQLNALKKAIEFKLITQGWNPITNTYPQKSAEEEEIEQMNNFTFSQAIDFAYNKKYPDWSKKSRQDYKSVVKYIKEGAGVIGILNNPLLELTRAHFRLLLEKVKVIRQLSNKGYNKYRDYLSALMGELESFDILEYNPVEKIKSKETIKVKAHRPPTRDQQLLIMNRIKDKHHDYYRFLAVLYGCTIRPKEICALKIKHLHRLEQIFRMTPGNESSTKTKTERDAAIPDWVMALLLEMRLDAYPPEHYIFSTQNKYGTFLPGPKRMHSNTPTNWWRQIVKAPVEKGGLNQDTDQYGLKKLSGDDMVRLQRREGVDKLLELPKAQMGHADDQMTEVYVGEHLEIMKDLVKRKMPIL